MNLGRGGKLSEAEQVDVRAEVNLLRRFGPTSAGPCGLVASEARQHEELRVQHRGRPYRVLFAFDPAQCGSLIAGTNGKAGGTRSCADSG